MKKELEKFDEQSGLPTQLLPTFARYAGQEKSAWASGTVADLQHKNETLRGASKYRKRALVPCNCGGRPLRAAGRKGMGGLAMNKFALGFAAAGLCLGTICQSASAADLAVRAPLPRQVIVPTWTGFYVGFNAGGGVANGHMLDQDCFECADTLFQTGFGTVGGQVGYNYQWNSVVLGVEADYNWLGAKKTNGFALDDCSLGPCAQAQFKLNSFASVRARAGLAVGPGLIYVTAGPVWGHFDSLINTLPGNGTNQFFISDNEWRAGIAAGAGLEFMPWGPNWVVRGEYLYLNFTDNTSACVPTAGSKSFLASCPFQFHINFGSTAQVARLGLNYKFGY